MITNRGSWLARRYKPGDVSSRLHRRQPVLDSSVKVKDLFAVLRNLLLLAAIYLYFIGWVYVYYYFHHFGISLFSLDIPVYYFFAYSNSVIGNLPAIAVLALLALLAYRFRQFLQKPYVVGPVVIILFPLFFVLARDTGISRAEQLRIAGAKPISFILKEEVWKHYSEEFKKANDCGNLRLIYQTKDRYFVFVQPTSKEKVLPRASTYDVRADHILLATIKLENLEIGGSLWLKLFGW